MKKIFFLIVISFSLVILQSCDNDKKDKDEKEVAINNVPAPVQSAFTAKYSTATDTKWEDAHENDKKTYKAKFMLNGKKMKAEFDADGGLIKESED